MTTMLVGLDLGTSSVKAECYDTRFENQCRHSTPLSLDVRHEDRLIIAEQDFKDIYQAVHTLLSRVLKELAKQGADTILLALSGQAPGLLLVDRRGEPLTPYISWMDRRAEEEARLLTRRLGEETIRRRTGLRPDPLFTGPKLMWLARRRPALVKSAWKALQLRDAVFLKLTGSPWTDHTHASETLLYRLEQGVWDDELADAIGVDTSLLPEIRESTDGLPIQDSVLREMGVDGVEVRVFLGCVDSVCSHLAAESGSGDRIVDTTGSSTCVNFSLETPHPDPWGAFEVYRHAVPGKYVGEASLPTGGSGLEHLVSLLEMTWEDLHSLEEAPAEAVVLPFLEGTRSPDWNPGLRGLVYGLSLSTGRGDLVKAYLQGVGLWLKTVVSLAEKWIGREYRVVRAVGGGSRIPLWNQIKAGVLGKRVEKYFWEDASSLGAAVVSYVGGGLGGWEEAFGRVDRVSEVYEPKSVWREWAARWEPVFKGLWRASSEFSSGVH